MSFSPTHNRYINFSTASYVEASSSIGPAGLDVLVSNMEWLAHSVNSNVLMNTNFIAYTPYITIAHEDSDGNNTIGKPYLIDSFGPIKISMNRIGLPSPIFVSSVQYVTANAGTSLGYFSFVFSDNVGSNSGWSILTSSIYNDSSPSGNYKILSGSFINTETNYVYPVTSSVTSLPTSTNMTQIVTRDLKNQITPNSNQLCRFGYLNAYYTVISSSTDSEVLPFVDGLTVREVCEKI